MVNKLNWRKIKSIRWKNSEMLHVHVLSIVFFIHDLWRNAWAIVDFNLNITTFHSFIYLLKTYISSLALYCWRICIGKLCFDRIFPSMSSLMILYDCRYIYIYYTFDICTKMFTIHLLHVPFNIPPFYIVF